MERRLWKPLAALILVQFCFASLAVAGKFALTAFPSLMVVGIRLFFASLFLAAIAMGVRRERMPLRDAVQLFGLAMLGVTFNQLLFLGGLARTSVVNASLLMATIPVFTTFFAILAKQESAKPARIVGIMVSLLGALTVMGIQGFDLRSDFALGNLFVVLNSMSYSIYLVYSRGLLKKYRSTTIVAWTFLYGAAVVTPLAAIRAASFDFTQVPATAWWAMAWIVIVPSVLSYSLNAYALKRIHSSTVATYVFLQPLFGIALALMLLPGEHLNLQHILGGILVLLGVVLVSRTESVEPTIVIPESGEAMSRHPIAVADGRAEPQSQEDDRRRRREEAS